MIASPDGTVTYWSPAAAAEFGWSELEARALGIEGLFPAAGALPADSGPEGAPGLEAGSGCVRLRLKNGKNALIESKIVPLVDDAGLTYAKLHVLRSVESNGKATGESERSPAIRAEATKGQVMHQLNNVFACIHSSLDIVLTTPQHPEAGTYLLLAQESAQRGARIVHELQLQGKELAGLAKPKNDEGTVKSGEGMGPSNNTPPAILEGSERLLLADDDRSLRTLWRAVLTYRGYKVVEATDGEDALNQYFANGPFDLLLVDMDMPKLRGEEVLRRIRARDASVRALALSGSIFGSEEGDEEGESEEGPKNPDDCFDEIIYKPFRNVDLVAMVRLILDRKATTESPGNAALLQE